MSRLLLSLKSVHAFEPKAELTSTKQRMTRSASPLVSVESHGDYALESLKSSSLSHMHVPPPFMSYNADTCAMDREECSSRQSLCPVSGLTSTRFPTPNMSSKAFRERQMRERMRAVEYGKRWWWWLLGVDSKRREARISVDASAVESWDPGDLGPGVKDSRLGRYDNWL